MGVTGLMNQIGWLFTTLKILGGVYIAWIGGKMVRGSHVGTALGKRNNETTVGAVECFRLGLLADLSNPRTIVFFTRIVASSIAWRTGLAFAVFSRPVGVLYRRFRCGVETLFGGLLALFRLRFAVEGQLR